MARRVRTVGMAPPHVVRFRAPLHLQSEAPAFRGGVPWLAGAMKERVGEGNKHADWCAKLIGALREGLELAGGWSSPTRLGLWEVAWFQAVQVPSQLSSLEN